MWEIKIDNLRLFYLATVDTMCCSIDLGLGILFLSFRCSLLVFVCGNKFVRLKSVFCRYDIVTA